MKTNSFAFSSAWGLGITAIAPWIIGTQFLTMPAAAATSGWENPCIEEPQSEECQYFTDFLAMHDQLWLTVWLQPYVHEASIMTLEETADPAVFDVDVWLDAGLDYEDPDLTEAEVLSQIVGSGSLDVAVKLPLAFESVQEVDPDDGTITTIEMTVNVIGGTLTGMTAIETPVLGVLTVTDVSSDPGESQHSRHLVVLELPASVEEAVAEAMLMAETTQTSGIGGRKPPGGGEPPTIPQIPPGYICPKAPDGSAMSLECCECNYKHDQCLALCRATRSSSFWGCFAAAGGVTAAVLGVCFAVCVKKGQAGNPLLTTGCLICLGGGTVALGVVWFACRRKSIADETICLINNNCAGVFAACLATNNCP